MERYRYLSNVKETDSDRTWLVVLIILAVAVAARVWGLDFGLPHPWSRPDESRIVNMAVKFGQGDLQPPFFNYPTLYPYLLSIVYGIYFVVGKVFGAHGSVHEFAVEFATNPTTFYLLNRVLSAIFGSLTVLVVFRIGQRLVNHRVAVLASLFLALAFLHVRDSHFGVTDVPMTFFIMTSTLYILKAGKQGRFKYYILAGLLAGLAASTKYAGFLLALPMLAAHIKAAQERGGRLSHFVFDKRLFAFGMGMLAAFLAGTPYAALKFSRFIADLSSEMSHLDSGHMGIILDRGWWHHLRFNLFYGLGWPLLAVSMAGIVVFFRQGYKKAIVFLAFPLVYYLWVGKGYTVFARYILPVIPFLCITAAVAIESVHEYVARKASRVTATTAVWVLAVILLLPSISQIWQVNRLLNRTDNRILASEWIFQHIPTGANIYQVNSGTGALQLDPGQFFLQKYARYRDLVNDGYTDQQLKSSVSGIVDSLVASRRYRQWLFDPDLDEFSFDGNIQDSLPRYIVVERVPLKHYDATPKEISRLITGSYRQIAQFVAFDTTANNLYDWQDHFYVPLAGFVGVGRPGPNLYLYELVLSSEASPEAPG